MEIIVLEDIRESGVLPSEIGVDPKSLFVELAKRGVEIIETSQVTSLLR